MSSPAPADVRALRSFRVAGALVQTELNRVTIEGRTVQLEPKIMGVLAVLASRAGEVVTKEELLQNVWNGTFVSDDVLTRAIGELRKLFADDAASPRVLETIRKRGYRLIAAVEDAEAGAPDARTPDAVAEGGVIGDGPERVASHAGAPATHDAPRAHARTTASRAALWLIPALAAAAALLAAGRLLRRVDAPAAVRVVPLSSLPGNEVDPALSPDGTRVAFAWGGEEGGQPSLFVKALDAAAPTRLTSGARDRHPAWLPDGSRLVFTRREGTACRLMEVTVPGGEVRSLGSCGDGDWGPARLAVSPDGKLVAFQDLHPSGAHGIVLLSRETLARSWLTVPPKENAGDEFAAFSPDGESVAFARCLAGGVDDIHVVPVGGGEPRRVTFDNASIEGIEWSPDSRTLAFSSSRAGLYSLWRVPAAGGTPSFVAGGGSKMKHPSAALRRNALAYESWIYEVNLWSVPLAGGSAATRLTSSTDEWEFQPEVSPDGTRVAFVSTRSGSEEIWLVDADGRNPLRVTSFGGPRVATPRWTPDGGRLVFSARPEGRADLYVVDVAERVPRRLTTDPADEVRPAVSRDGRSLFYSAQKDGVWDVWRMPLAGGGTPVRVTEGGGFAAAEGADGFLYFVRLGKPGLWRVRTSAEGASAAPELAVADLPADSWAEWTLTGDGILHRSGEREERPVLSLTPFGGGPRREVTTLENQAWSGFTATTDGGTLVYARSDRRYVDLKMIENPF